MHSWKYELREFGKLKRLLEYWEVWSELHCKKCETNTIPILMHQIHISTNWVSSVKLKPKKLEIRIHCENCKRAWGKNKTTECHEIEPNPSKNRAMHLGWMRFEMNLWITFFLDSSIHIRIFKQVPKYNVFSSIFMCLKIYIYTLH
jgi:hypothetical protein